VRTQNRELSFRCIAYNTHRLTNLTIIRWFLQSLCAITKKTYSDSGNYNRLHFHDLGAANENMFLESFNQGLIMHEMGGFHVQRARSLQYT
jgi:hypothetical protein